MTTRRLLRSLILAIASIVLAIILAFAYCLISEETNVFNNVLKAAEQGDPNAVEEKDSLKKKMSPQQIDEAVKIAKEFKLKINNATLKADETK